MTKDFLQENCKQNVTSAKLCIHTGKQIACFLCKTNFSQKRKKKKKEKAHTKQTKTNRPTGNGKEVIAVSSTSSS